MISKTHDIHIRLSEKEKDVIRQKAKAAGCKSISDYMRKIALKGLIITLKNDLDFPSMKNLDDQYFQLRRIGTNVNQIARKINEKSRYSQEDRELLKKIISDFSILSDDYKMTAKSVNMYINRIIGV
jgi:hypothetical protein